MGKARLVGFRRHGPHIVREGRGDTMEDFQSLGMDAVIIGDQDAHQESFAWPMTVMPPI